MRSNQMLRLGNRVFLKPDDDMVLFVEVMTQFMILVGEALGGNFLNHWAISKPNRT